MQVLVKLVGLVWIGAGVSLYVMKELKAVPMGTLGWYVLIWVAAAYLAQRNRFEHM